jgi:hypothetical protein
MLLKPPATSFMLQEKVTHDIKSYNTAETPRNIVYGKSIYVAKKVKRKKQKKKCHNTTTAVNVFVIRSMLEHNRVSVSGKNYTSMVLQQSSCCRATSATSTLLQFVTHLIGEIRRLFVTQSNGVEYRQLRGGAPVLTLETNDLPQEHICCKKGEEEKTEKMLQHHLCCKCFCNKIYVGTQ